jgi:hypothetical protein
MPDSTQVADGTLKTKFVWCPADGPQSKRQITRAHCLLKYFRACATCPHQNFKILFKVPSGTNLDLR